jgi:hypothetical protein
MAPSKTIFSILLMFIMAIYSKSDIVETKEEIQGEENYVAPPDRDSLGNNLITELRCHLYFLF